MSSVVALLLLLLLLVVAELRAHPSAQVLHV